MMDPTQNQANKIRVRRICRTAAAPDLIAKRRYADPDKALVMEYFSELVSSGFAEWRDLGGGEIELRYRSGEVFLLAKRAITRTG